MSYCFQPACKHPQNPSDVSYCRSCGSKLLLQECYRALKPIGQGGFGRTFLAVDESQLFKPSCVIKQFFLQNQSSNNEQKAAELFHQEALRLSALGKHPQIPELLVSFEEDEQQYLVQEFINGQNLEQELAEAGVFNETQIRSLLNELLPVLRFIHDYQVIHRDIKPANIIRRYCDGQLVLVDFGAAKCVTGTALAKTGTMIGSAEYTAPEQARGKAVFASDLYSLGVTCIHLLTQIPPFELFDSSEDAWVWRDYLSYPVSEALGQILDKLLQNATKRCYQAVEEVLKDLNVEPTPVVSELLATIDTIDLRSLEVASSTSTNPSLPVKPVLPATVFDPETQSWYRVPDLNVHSEFLWAVASFMRPRLAHSSSIAIHNLMPQITPIATQKEKKRPWWVSTALVAAVITCFSVGPRLHKGGNLSTQSTQATSGADIFDCTRLNMNSSMVEPGSIDAHLR